MRTVTLLCILLSGCSAVPNITELLLKPHEIRIRVIIEDECSMGRADFYRHGDNNVICDRCGFKYKASDLRREWNGLHTCPFDFEPRHPQDLIRSKHDDQRPSLSRPEGADVFVPPPPPPIANAGPDQGTVMNSLTTLDGSASVDLNGGLLSYLWTQTGGIAVTLSSVSAVMPTFTTPGNLLANEVLEFTLVAIGGLDDSLPDTVTVTVAGNILGAWVNDVNVTIGPGFDITKSGGLDGQWDATAISLGSISGDGYVEITPTTLSEFRMIGFVESDPALETNIKWGFFLVGTAPGTTLNKIENGNVAIIGSGFVFAVGDVLRVQRIGQTISYFKNGAVIEISSILSAPISPLFVKATLNDLPSTIQAPALFDILS